MSSQLKEIDIIKKNDLYDRFGNNTVKDKFLDFSMFPNIYKKNVTVLTEGKEEIELKTEAEIKFANGCIGSSTVDTLSLQEIVPFSITTYNRSDTEVTSITKLVLPPEMEIIPPYAFTNLPNLEHIVFPVKVLVIGDYVCKGLSKLKSVVFPGREAVTAMGEGCFEDCINLSEVVFPTAIKKTKHKTNFNFNYYSSGYTDSSEASMKDTLSGIPDFTFMNCKSLKRINLKGIKVIGYKAFYNCSELETIYNCNGVEHILDYAFGNTKKLKILNKFNNIISFGRYAFAHSGLNGVYITTHQHVILGSGSFSGNLRLREFELFSQGLEIKDGSFVDCPNLIRCRVNNVIDIMQAAFIRCGIVEIDLKDSYFVTLNTNVFVLCNNLFKVVLPDTLRTIMPDAFYQCPQVCEFECLSKECTCISSYLFDPEHWIAPSIKFYIRQYTALATVAQRTVALRQGEIVYHLD